MAISIAVEKAFDRIQQPDVINTRTRKELFNLIKDTSEKLRASFTPHSDISDGFFLLKLDERWDTHFCHLSSTLFWGFQPLQ